MLAFINVFAKSADATVYAVLAIASTLMFVLKMLLMFVGIGHHDVDIQHDLSVDHGGAGDHHADGSDQAFQLFSVQSVLAFFMGLGWMGLTARLQWGFNGVASLGLAVGFGFLVMLLSAGLSFYARKMASDPKLDIKTCVGTTGRVYLTIPAKGQGEGQVEVNLSGQRKIVQAVSTGGEIAAFAIVNIVAVDEGERVSVEPRP